MEPVIGKEYPCKNLPSGLGLAGDELQIAKAHICVAKSVTILFQSLKKGGTSEDKVTARVCKVLGMNSDAVNVFVKVHNAYNAYGNSGRLNFDFFFLYTVGISKLNAFVPVLIAFYTNKSGDLRSNLEMTTKSIELRIPVSPDRYRWFHLADLTTDQIKSFKKRFVLDGSTPTSSTPVNEPSISDTNSMHMSDNSMDMGYNSMDMSDNSMDMGYDPMDMIDDPMSMGYNSMDMSDDPMGYSPVSV